MDTLFSVSRFQSRGARENLPDLEEILHAISLFLGYSIFSMHYVYTIIYYLISVRKFCKSFSIQLRTSRFEIYVHMSTTHNDKLSNGFRIAFELRFDESEMPV